MSEQLCKKTFLNEIGRVIFAPTNISSWNILTPARQVQERIID
jgi:hypothetical protein